MKKLILFLIFIFLITNSCSAQQANSAEILEAEVIELDVEQTSLLDVPVEESNSETTLEDLTIEKDVYKTGIQKYYTFDKGLLKLRLNEKLNFDFGMIGDTSWAINNRDDDLHSQFYMPSVDFVLSGKLNEYLDYKAQMFGHRNIEEKTILGDLWLRGKYKNYVAQIGRMRKPFAYEPTFSSFDLDFATRSQIGRLFGDHRDSGGKIMGQYKYADVALGLFSSMQNRPFNFGNKGIEFDSWLVLKPLADYDNLGELKLAGGIATGKHDLGYTNYSAFASYKYKKWGLKGEYIYKEPTFYDDNKADGFYVDSSYFLTNKLQGMVRFDSYKPNNDKRSNEYVAGLKYYINGPNIVMVLNYAYIDDVINSHRVALQMRYKTW